MGIGSYIKAIINNPMLSAIKYSNVNVTKTLDDLIQRDTRSKVQSFVSMSKEGGVQ